MTNLKLIRVPFFNFALADERYLVGEHNVALSGGESTLLEFIFSYCHSNFFREVTLMNTAH